MGGGVLLIHSEIYYVPIGDGWEEVLVHNVLHYVTPEHPSMDANTIGEWGVGGLQTPPPPPRIPPHTRQLQ